MTDFLGNGFGKKDFNDDFFFVLCVNNRPLIVDPPYLHVWESWSAKYLIYTTRGCFNSNKSFSGVTVFEKTSIYSYEQFRTTFLPLWILHPGSCFELILIYTMWGCFDTFSSKFDFEKSFENCQQSFNISSLFPP